MPKHLAQPGSDDTAPLSVRERIAKLAARFTGEAGNVAPAADHEQYPADADATASAETPQGRAAREHAERLAARFLAAQADAQSSPAAPPSPSPAPASSSVPPPVDAPSASGASSAPADAGELNGPSMYACEQAEIARGRHGEGAEWKRHQPRQPSPHRAARDFGGWIDQNPARVTNEPAPMAGLVSARAMSPGLLSPTAPALLQHLAGELSIEESDDGIGFAFPREPFADVPREPAPPLSSRERKRLRSDEERYAERAMMTDAAMRRWAARWRELGESIDHLPPLADPESFAICRAVVCSREAADASLRMIGNSYGGNVLYRVQRFVFGTPDQTKWDTRMLCARRALALALFMLRQSRLKYTGKRDRYGRPIMQPCVWGIGRGYLQALLAEPLTLKPLSRERLTHSNASCVGLFAKAEAARVFVRQSKIPPEVAEADEIGPSGFTFNRYWVCRHLNLKASLREELDGMDAHEASAAAWAWLDAGIRAAVRGRFLQPTASVDQKWAAREAPS